MKGWSRANEHPRSQGVTVEVRPKGTPKPRRKYSGKSHTLLVLGPPAVGYVVSVLFVVFGPYDWWLNYLVAGLVWGLTTPVRNVVRAGFKYVTAEFRDANLYSWKDCVQGEVASELAEFRRNPKEYIGAVLTVTGVHALCWPVSVYLGAMIKGSVDHG